jgi:hypothetical protein
LIRARTRSYPTNDEMDEEWSQTSVVTVAAAGRISAERSERLRVEEAE